MKQQKSTENYLKAIYILAKSGEVRGTDIAEYLGVSRPTVSVSLKALENEGYVTVSSLHRVHLTELGETVARSTYEKNRTIRSLMLLLGVDEKTAERDACEMEHAVSAESFMALKRLVELLDAENVRNGVKL